MLYLRRMLPSALFRDVYALDRDAFLQEHGNVPLLCVKTPADDSDLGMGVRACWPRESGTRPHVRSAPLPFRTATKPEARVSRRPPGDHPAPSLPGIFATGAYVAVLVQKRSDASSASASRISIGRAANNDVVLRHSSVSKFHAWLEPVADGTLKVYDPASTNRTFVNEAGVPRRLPIEAHSGDTVRFGDVEAIVWSLGGLWLSQHPARASQRPARRRA